MKIKRTRKSNIAKPKRVPRAPRTPAVVKSECSTGILRFPHSINALANAHDPVILAVDPGTRYFAVSKIRKCKEGETSDLDERCPLKIKILYLEILDIGGKRKSFIYSIDSICQLFNDGTVPMDDVTHFVIEKQSVGQQITRHLSYALRTFIITRYPSVDAVLLTAGVTWTIRNKLAFWLPKEETLTVTGLSRAKARKMRYRHKKNTSVETIKALMDKESPHFCKFICGKRDDYADALSLSLFRLMELQGVEKQTPEEPSEEIISPSTNLQNERMDRRCEQSEEEARDQGLQAR